MGWDIHGYVKVVKLQEKDFSSLFFLNSNVPLILLLQLNKGKISILMYRALELMKTFLYIILLDPHKNLGEGGRAGSFTDPIFTEMKVRLGKGADLLGVTRVVAEGFGRAPGPPQGLWARPHWLLGGRHGAAELWPPGCL